MPQQPITGTTNQTGHTGPSSTTLESQSQTGRTTSSKPEITTPYDYFALAKTLIVITICSIIGFALIIIILNYIFPSECAKNSATSIIKDYLYPFLTLLAGFIFGKGIPKKSSK